jgi:hypothetical protein
MLSMNISVKNRDWDGVVKSADNFHRIAISNLSNRERGLVRWWCKKYRQPQKPLEEMFLEEIYVEHLEDYYERNPEAIAEFKGERPVDEDDDWDGKLPPETEAKLKKFHSKHKVDLSKYKTNGDENLTDEQCRVILDRVGRSLPESSFKTEVPADSTEEFDDNFEV